MKQKSKFERNVATTIREMVKFVSWKEVREAIKHLYPDDKNNYKPVFEYLTKVRKRKHKDPKEFIEIKAVNEHFDKEYAGWYSMATNKYALSFRKWNELSNTPISKETLDRFTYLDIVAHFIWEITFYGTEKDAEKLAKELQGRVDEFEKEQKCLKK